MWYDGAIYYLVSVFVPVDIDGQTCMQLVKAPHPKVPGKTTTVLIIHPTNYALARDVYESRAIKLVPYDGKEVPLDARSLAA